MSEKCPSATNVEKLGEVAQPYGVTILRSS